jgi:hypothetical protein
LKLIKGKEMELKREDTEISKIFEITNDVSSGALPLGDHYVSYLVLHGVPVMDHLRKDLCRSLVVVPLLLKLGEL